MLELKRLLLFREVAQRGSFSAAAQALSYTQPAVSHHIAQLELEIGGRLLERGPRSLRLTSAGTALLTHAERIVAELHDAEAALADALGTSASQVRIGAFATANATFVADALAAQRLADPPIATTLVEGEATETLALLRAREIDIAVVYDDDPTGALRAGDLACTFLHDDAMLVALPRGHRFAGCPTVAMADLAGEAWIEGERADTPASLLLLDAARRAGFVPKVAFNSGDYQVVQRLVSVGVGVALVPALAVGRPNPDLVLRPVAPDPPSRRIALVLRRDGFRSAATTAMARQLKASIARLTRRRPWWAAEAA